MRWMMLDVRGKMDEVGCARAFLYHRQGFSSDSTKVQHFKSPVVGFGGQQWTLVDIYVHFFLSSKKEPKKVMFIFL